MKSIPPGLTVQLYRGKVIEGMSTEVDDWMRMLDDRLDECTATVDRERMAIEIVFRQRDGDEEFLYWIVVRGDGETVETSTSAIDRDHIAYDERCRQRGWQTGEPQLLLMPDAVRKAVVDHCRLDRPSDDHPN